MADYLDYAANIKEIKGADFVLAKENDAWTLAGQHSDTATTLDTEKAEQLSRVLDLLRVTGVAGKPPAFSANEVISLDVAGEDDWRYPFQEKDSQYFVRRVGEGGSKAPVFTLSHHDYNRIAGIGPGGPAACRNG